MEASGDLLSDSVLHVLGNLKHQGPNARRIGRDIVAEMEITPPKLEKNGIAKLEPPDHRLLYKGSEGFDPREGQRQVAIFCGGSAENWGPHSRQSGIGGSEKMVLMISEELQARDVNVTVYGEVAYKARGVDEDGVMWRHWAEFDGALALFSVCHRGDLFSAEQGVEHSVFQRHPFPDSSAGYLFRRRTAIASPAPTSHRKELRSLVSRAHPEGTLPLNIDEPAWGCVHYGRHSRGHRQHGTSDRCTRSGR